MKNKWTINKLIAAGSLGVLDLTLRILGSTINSYFGTVGSSFINTLIGSALVVICLFVLDQFGSVSIMYTVLGIMALPFNISGTPGFLPKIPIMIIGGLIIDKLFHFLKSKNHLTSFIVGGTRTLYVGFSVIGIGYLLKTPGMEISSNFLVKPIGMVSAFTLGGFGGFIGFYIYKKIKNSSVIKRL